MTRHWRGRCFRRESVSVVLVLVAAFAWSAGAQNLISEIQIPNVTKDTKIECTGTFTIKSGEDGAAPTITGRLLDGSRTIEKIELAIKQGRIKGEFTFSGQIDFSDHVKAGETKAFKLTLTSNKSGEFKGVKISR